MPTLGNNYDGVPNSYPKPEVALDNVFFGACLPYLACRFQSHTGGVFRMLSHFAVLIRLLAHAHSNACFLLDRRSVYSPNYQMGSLAAKNAKIEPSRSRYHARIVRNSPSPAISSHRTPPEIVSFQISFSSSPTACKHATTSGPYTDGSRPGLAGPGVQWLQNHSKPSRSALYRMSRIALTRPASLKSVQHVVSVRRREHPPHIHGAILVPSFRHCPLRLQVPIPYPKPHSAISGSVR